MAKKTSKPRKTPAQRFFERAESDPNIAILNWEKEMERAPNLITGSAKDLIRDAYNDSQPWLHNGHALPDDRRKAFLVGRGWSATPQKRKLLSRSRIPVMAINDYPDDPECKPRYWCSGDPPSYFGERIWNDPDVVKFASMQSIKITRPRVDGYAPRFTSKDAPNVHFFHEVNNETEVESWLHLPYIPWGTSIWGPRCPSHFYSGGAARSSMLIGLRLLWHLGYREVCLLGCDCTPGHHPYPQYWNTIFHLINQIAPVFKRWGYHVCQTNQDSHLRCFDFIDFEKAVA